ncbi:MAG: hypothetical protein HY319_10655 [Armatimonadetes bacterium]|nr:hypothetical protein [Armatimonadota bacterium]
MTLGTTLIVLAIVVTLAFTLAGTSVNHLRLTSRMGNSIQAHNLAESVLAKGIERVMANRSYGLAGDTLEIFPTGAPSGSRGVLTFDAAAGGAYCTNNLEGDSSVRGSGDRAVPAASVHLIGTGTCRGSVCRMEAIVHVPRFPYAIASSGPVRSTGALLVAGVGSVADLAGGVPVVNPEKLLPGHLATNATSPDAISLGPGTTVTGDIQSSGGFLADTSSVQVLGEIRTYADPARIPRIDVALYDPALLGNPGLQTLTQEFMSAPLFEGYVRRQGDLHVNGSLTLDGALLYVEGNLAVDGGIHGSGAVFVTGTTTISGATRLTADSVAALVSRGDIWIGGNGAQDSFFQGLLYTEGNFTADRVTLMGTFIANGPAGSAMTLNDSTLIHVPEYAAIEIPLNSAPPGAGIFEMESGVAETVSSDKVDDDIFTASVEPDGTYTVGYPFGGITVEGLKLAQAMDQIELWLPADEWDRAAVLGALQSLRRDLARTVSAPTAQPETVVVDPSRFLRMEEKARVLMWRQL